MHLRVRLYKNVIPAIKEVKSVYYKTYYVVHDSIRHSAYELC